MNGKARFKKLLEPSHIGSVQTRNRMVKTVGPGLAAARGGVGLITMGGYALGFPILSSINQPGGPCLQDVEHIAGFSEITQTIHKHDCPVFLQVYHIGAWTADFPGVEPISASPLTESEVIKLSSPHLMCGVPRGLTIPEIKEMEDELVRAAEATQKAGFDGVEINVGSCHLGNSFLSRAWNKRHDEYGCDTLENRARFAVEIIRETKKRAGQDFPVIVLFNVIEYGIDNGITIEEGKEFARMFEKAGADAIQVRVYGYGVYDRLHYPESIFYLEPPKPLAEELDWSHRGAGAYLPLGAKIKKVVSIPVIVAGRMTPEIGEKALQEGKADFIGFCRSLIADPELPNKVASGRLDDIAPCTACHTCTSSLAEGQHDMSICRVNAAWRMTSAVSEQEYVIEPAEKRKRVVVVGGGPAGMEAARVAALRGHEVMLYEREPKLGGLLPLAALVKGVDIEDLPAMVRYLKNQITKLGVKINLGKEVNPSLINEIKPDVVILATGGLPAVPEIPGINRRHVVSMANLHRRVNFYLRLFGPKALRWLTKFWMPLGKRVVIIGGDIQGCELAVLLVKRGRKVTIVDTAEKLGEAVPIVNRLYLLPWLPKKGITLMPGVRYEEITEKGLTVTTKEGKRQTIEADTIVPAIPLAPNTELLSSLEGKVPEIYSVGDCKDPRLIVDAIADGWRVGCTI